MSKVQERWFDWTYDGRGWYLVNDPEVTFYGEEEAMAYCDEHNRNLVNESYREGREQAERETVEKIVAWLRNTGIGFEGSGWADCIERGEWKQ